MFLLVPAHPGFPGQIPQSRKMVVVVVVVFLAYEKPLEMECENILKYVSKCLLANVKKVYVFRSKIFISTWFLRVV